ncbi:MAG TPA: PqqD family protein [Usitatibacter sp.]|nr:PqqD family protein [Usitatibacter sp.]
MTDRYIARAPDVAARTIGDELMIMSGRDSSLFSLNETAAALWDLADGTTPLAEIVERHICAEFDVDPEEALADAQALADELAAHGILIVSDAPIRR